MKNRSVVLVEDDRLVADMYRIGLEQRGFEVTIYTDAAAFLGGVDAAVPDVVVLDWNLGALTGGQVLCRLRQSDRTRRLPVLILSNDRSRDNAETAISRYGALAWLGKLTTPPVRLAEHIAAVFEDPQQSPD